MYSRRLRVQEKKDKRSAFIYIVFSIASLIILFTVGIPYSARFIGFLSEFKGAASVPNPQDQTPPPPPTFLDLPKATNKSNLELEGSTEPGVTLIVTLNGTQNEALANSEGKFLITLNLIDGENIISAKARDKAGNESVHETTAQIIFDDEPPQLTIETPSDGEAFFGEAQRVIAVKGQSEAGAKVTIAGRQTIVSSEGNFNHSLGLNDGENDIVLISEDRAGNKTELNLKVKFSP